MEIFNYNYLTISFIAAILAGLTTSILSVFVSLKKISYMGEALSHVSFAGIAIALLSGFNIDLVTLLFVVLVAILIGYISRKYSIDESNVTTIFLAVSMALAIILINISKNYTFDLSGYLFGNILLVNKNDLINMGVLLFLNVLFLTIFFKELFYLSYNHSISLIFKIPVNFVYYLFLIFIAVNIVVSVKSIGIVLITAQLILPGTIALNFTKKIKKAIFSGIIISEISTISGFFVSQYFDIPSGATIVLILFLFFLISLVYKLIINR